MKANRSLIAFLLAGLTAGILFTSFNCLSSVAIGRDSIVVATTKGTDVEQAVAAINGLDLPGVKAEKVSRVESSVRSIVLNLAFFTLGFLIITGFVLFFYKLYCRWFDAAHHI